MLTGAAPPLTFLPAHASPAEAATSSELKDLESCLTTNATRGFVTGRGSAAMPRVHKPGGTRSGRRQRGQLGVLHEALAHVPYHAHPPTGTKRWQVGPALPTTRRRAVHEVYWVRGIGGEVGPSGREVERQVMRG